MLGQIKMKNSKYEVNLLFFHIFSMLRVDKITSLPDKQVNISRSFFFRFEIRNEFESMEQNKSISLFQV